MCSAVFRKHFECGRVVFWFSLEFSFKHPSEMTGSHSLRNVVVVAYFIVLYQKNTINLIGYRSVEWNVVIFSGEGWGRWETVTRTSITGAENKNTKKTIVSLRYIWDNRLWLYRTVLFFFFLISGRRRLQYNIFVSYTKKKKIIIRIII